MCEWFDSIKTNRKVMARLRRELKAYMGSIGELNADEMECLREWVADGNSVYDNPYYLYTEYGDPFCYITAIRINADMMENPEDYGIDLDKIEHQHLLRNS